MKSFGLHPSLPARSLAGLLSSLAACALLSCGTSTNSSNGSGSCPCTVGNSGIHVTIGCGQSTCVTLNGTVTGYYCGANGAVEDPAACTPGQDSSTQQDDSATSCEPKTCGELSACGEADDACGGTISCPGCDSGTYCSAANHCLQTATSFLVYGNYQGGTFTIDIDKHVPNLAIGLVSYQPMNVTVSGAYVGDVVAVYHAGYAPGTTVTGVDPLLFADARLPPATVDAGFADSSILCEISASGPGCNPAWQVEAFFASTLGGTLLYNQCQYDAYSGTLSVSDGGQCL